MCHIQNFTKEVGNIAHIMYSWLAKFVQKSKDAFTKRQLITLYMEK